MWGKSASSNGDKGACECHASCPPGSPSTCGTCLGAATQSSSSVFVQMGHTACAPSKWMVSVYVCVRALERRPAFVRMRVVACACVHACGAASLGVRGGVEEGRVEEHEGGGSEFCAGLEAWRMSH